MSRTKLFAKLREEFVAICDGDATAALILDRFEYWSRAKHETAEDRWIYKSSSEFAEVDLFGIVCARTVRNKITDLIEMGILERREGNRRDQAREYCLDVERLDELLRDAGYGGLDGWVIDQDEPPKDLCGRAGDSSDDGGGSDGEPPTDEPEDDVVDMTGHIEHVDTAGRDPVPEGQRMDSMEYAQKYSRCITRWKHSQINRDRRAHILRYFRPQEINDAFEATMKSADRPGWGYLRKVLESMAVESQANVEVDDEMESFLDDIRRQRGEL